MTYQIKENAKNVWIRDNENTQDLSPLTDANSVYFNSGRTLEQELGKGVMESNIVTIDSTMSKVIDEAYDGVYESCVFKGRSLVNLFDKSEIATNHASYTVGTDNTISFVANNGFAKGVDLSHLKPNTKYALFFDVLTVSQEPNIPYRINDDGTNYNVNIFGQGQDNPTSGFHSFTTGSDVSDLKFFFYTNLRNVGFKLTLPVIIEYQDGMENWGIPYFDGIGYAKMPILHNVGKNLFEDNVAIQGYHNGLDTFYNDSNFITYKNPISVVPNTEYIFGNNIQTRYGRINFYDKNMKIISSITDQNLSPFTTPSNCHFVRFSTYRNTGIKPSEIIWSQLEVGRIATPYEPYKTNILRTPEEIVLREVNGVQDTYNAITGEYVQRIGERDYIEGDFTDVNVKTDGVKTQYELTEPVTTIVEPSTIPFIYQNGHIILESGYKGQSLTPILEYTASVSRTGQVENVAKTIQRHETQLTLLEKMLIGNIIELDYNNTLMALNLKMDEVK